MLFITLLNLYLRRIAKVRYTIFGLLNTKRKRILGTVVILWFILMTKVYLNSRPRPRPPPRKGTTQKVPPTTTIPPNIALREELYKLIVSTDRDQGIFSNTTPMDLLLNIRKLTLFAVHELNRKMSCREENGTSKWWTNPLDILALNTTDFEDYSEHDLVFPAQPHTVPYCVRIRQNKILELDMTNWTELEVLGEFVNLGGGDLCPQVGELDTDESNQSLDPELYLWKRHQSYFVGDYIYFGDLNLYKISPGGNPVVTRKIYCGQALKMLIMVSSAPELYEHRRVIRKTYGSDTNLHPKEVRLVFLFGVVLDESIQRSIEIESGLFGDIIQADFMDSYHNLTLSHLSMYNWVQTTCDSVGLPKYVLKADDDFLLNVDLAMEVAYRNPSIELIGMSYCGTYPLRKLEHKYYTPRYMHMSDRYFGYLSGVAYLLRTDIIPRMLKISLTTPMIHMDDAYMTGILPRQLGILPADSPLFDYDQSQLDACSLKQMASSKVHNVTDMITQWMAFLKPIPLNCSLTSLQSQIVLQNMTQGDKNFCNFV